MHAPCRRLSKHWLRSMQAFTGLTSLRLHSLLFPLTDVHLNCLLDSLPALVALDIRVQVRLLAMTPDDMCYARCYQLRVLCRCNTIQPTP